MRHVDASIRYAASTNAMSLCQRCRSIADTAISRTRATVLHHDSAGSLKESVESSCFICARVWDSLSGEQRAAAESPSFMGIRYLMKTVEPSRRYGSPGEQPLLANILCEHGDDLYDCEDYNVVGGWWKGNTGNFAVLNPLSMSVNSGLSPGEQQIVQRRYHEQSLVLCEPNMGVEYPVNEVVELPGYTNHPSCWNTASKWIESCCSEHETCRESRGSGWLPKRLVEISGDGSGRIRVVNSSALPATPGTRYLALSHCWGREPFLVLDQDNQAEFARGVFISSLAPNFRDAIYTTLKLGFRYIWIDSLCILQGSRKDWEEQAPVMNKVYKNSHLTLGALASPDAHGGFFKERNPEMVRPCPFKIRTEDDGLVDCLVIKSDFWEKDVRQAPLNQRAWVLQERLLAPRTLYFGQTQIYWECQELHACEIFPAGTPVEFISEIEDPEAIDAVSVKSFRRTVSWLADTTIDKSYEDPELDNQRLYYSPYRVWDGILQSYTRCALTKPADKFVAISGVVKEFTSLVGDDYLAGLWRRVFLDGLLWRVHEDPSTGHFVPAVRPDESQYRAPSWSWAALDSPNIRARPSDYVDRLETERYGAIGDVNVVPRSGDPTGELSHACLHARGYLIKTSRNLVRGAYDHRRFGHFYPDTVTVLSQGDALGASFFCWPLGEERYSGYRDPTVLGLVLALVTDGKEEYISCCSRCSGKMLLTRVGSFSSDKGNPLKLLSVNKPEDWDSWVVGKENFLTWFPEDAPLVEFAVI